MSLKLEEITSLIKVAMPDAQITIQDLVGMKIIIPQLLNQRFSLVKAK